MYVKLIRKTDIAYIRDDCVTSRLDVCSLSSQCLEGPLIAAPAARLDELPPPAQVDNGHGILHNWRQFWQFIDDSCLSGRWIKLSSYLRYLLGFSLQLELFVVI